MSVWELRHAIESRMPVRVLVLVPVLVLLLFTLVKFLERLDEGK